MSTRLSAAAYLALWLVAVSLVSNGCGGGDELVRSRGGDRARSDQGCASTRESVRFGFQSRPGWHAATTGLNAHPPLVPNAIAANVALDPDATASFPLKLLARLRPGGIVLVAQLYPHPAGESGNLGSLILPLQLSKFEKRERWEMQPNSSVPEYILFGKVEDRFLDVRVYFGTQQQTAEDIRRAQQVLNCLMLPVT
jgi:hypothetical protein